MEYKVFYAYQSDIPKEINETFIERALEKAAGNIKSASVKIIKGFKGTSGQKPLAQTMFDQSAACDIFFADVTYTSSRHQHAEKRWFAVRKTDYLTRDMGSVKWSPNPNVLIETGFSWARKDYDRTILVMNKAFGIPEDFPVDMKHIRFPIAYSLSVVDGKKDAVYKKVFDELVTDITKALKDALKTTQRYHREKFRPFRIHEDWKSTDFDHPYILIDEIIDIIKKLRNALSKANNPQRLLGPKNSGKTRLAYELYRKQNAELKREEAIEKILYYDLELTSYSSIEKQIQELAVLNQDKIIVVDNCDDKTHKKIYNDFYKSKIRILTIAEYKKGVSEQATVSLTDEIATKLVSISINEKFAGKNAAPLIETSQSNVREALAYVNSSINDGTELSLQYDAKWLQFLGEDLAKRGGLIVLEAVSLFTHVGISGQFKSQADLVASLLCQGMKPEQFMKLVNDFVDRNMIKKQGDFVILETFADELSLAWWHRQTADTIGAVIKQTAEVGLSKQFSERLILLSQTKSGRNVLGIITGGVGILNDYDFVNTDQGAKVIHSLAEIIPELIIETLDKTFANKTTDDLKAFEDGRRYLVWALEKLVFRKETFERAAKLMFRLALAENEEISNNATAQFQQLFQPYLGGTEVSLIERFNLIEKLAANADKDQMLLLLGSCERALSTGQFVRSGGAEHQGGEELRDFVPRQDEVEAYWKSVIIFLLNKL